MGNMISRYDSVLSTIAAYFSAELGASEESIGHFINYLQANPIWRDSLRMEIEQSLKDGEMSWRTELWSEYCHVFNATSEGEARDWVACNVLSLVNPQVDGQPA